MGRKDKKVIASKSGRSAAKPRRAPRENEARRRNRILEAAERLFLRKGYSATSTRGIARAAGVSLGNLYNHFAGKEELFDSLIAMRSPTPEVEELVKLFERTDFPANLWQILSRLQEIVDQNMAFVRLTDIDGVEFGGKKTQKIIAASLSRVWDPLEKVYRRHRELGLVREFDPRVTLPLIVLALFAMFVVRGRFNTPELFGAHILNDDVALKSITEVLLLGILPRK
jgi:AcrR family transcriptional regulator